MSTIGKGSLSLRKKDVSNQRSLAIGTVKVVFAHKATGGESTISLNALSAPSEMLSSGFVQPSTSLLSDLNIYQYRNNLTLRSSIRGTLWDYTSYTVANNSTINFIGFTLLPNEIITGTLDNAPRNGTVIVADGAAISTTGLLAAGQTDFNVGTPFETNKYPTQQAGAVLVYRNGLLQARCEGNSLTNDGNYIEVPVSGGFGTLIRFKFPAVNTADSIIVTSNGAYFERPSASTMATVETLAGQMDKVISVLADASGTATTYFQGAPNNVDLLTFGNRVLAAETAIATNGLRITALEKSVSPGFSVFLSATTVVNNALVPWNSIEWNIGTGTFSGGQYIIPKAGRWLFTLKVTSGISQSLNFNYLSVNGARRRDMFEALSFVTNSEYTASVILNLDQYDTVGIYNTGSFEYQGTNANFYSLFQGQYLP